jgi:tRNA(Ile)-lysidine synthase
MRRVKRRDPATLTWDASDLPDCSRIVVSVSGGADSLTLLHLLCAARAEHRWDLMAVHVHHGMRGESAEDDVRFLEETCRGWDIPLEVARVNVPAIAEERGISVEEAGRLARYEELGHIALHRECGIIATAHTADDQAETVLMRFFRGAGIDGLAGIPRRRPLHHGQPGPVVVRPLLDVWRRDIEAYCNAHGLWPRHDVTNLDRRYRRSRIRLELIPLLEEYDPHLRSHLARLAAQAWSERDLLSTEARALYSRSCIQSTAYGMELGLLGEALAPAPPALVRRVIRLALEDLRLQDLDREAEIVGRVYALLTGRGRGGFELPGKKLRVVRNGADVWFQLVDRRTLLPPTEVRLADGESWLPEWGFTIRVVEAGCPSEARQPPHRVYLDAEAVKKPLLLRVPQRGDRLRPLGSPGSKLLSDLFGHKKVPRTKRVEWPVMVDEVGIVWVVGLAVAERCRVTDSTKRCLLLEVDPLPPIRS